jgi:hypothetical protein
MEVSADESQSNEKKLKKRRLKLEMLPKTVQREIVKTLLFFFLDFEALGQFRQSGRLPSLLLRLEVRRLDDWCVR